MTSTSFPALEALARPISDGACGPASRGAGPPPSLEQLRSRRDELLGRLARYGVDELRVFGSVARGLQGPGSDLDVLVDLDPARHGLLDLAGIGAVLEELLGCPVDVVAPRLLREPPPDAILREAVPV